MNVFQRPFINLKDGLALLARRRGRHAPVAYSWFGWALLGAAIVLPLVWIVDPLIGRHHGEFDPLAVAIATIVTDIGRSNWMYAALGLFILAMLLRDWRGLAGRRLLRAHEHSFAALYMLGALGAQTITVSIVKHAVGRARPALFNEVGAHGFDSWTFTDFYASFPSGHSANIGCAAASLALLYPRLRLPALIVALWVGLSRVVVGAHYPGDVVAGLMFGAWMAYAAAVFMANRSVLFRVKPGELPRRR